MEGCIPARLRIGVRHACFPPVIGPQYLSTAPNLIIRITYCNWVSEPRQGRHREAVMEFDKLTLKIRAQSEFQGVLLPPAADKLMAAAVHLLFTPCTFEHSRPTRRIRL